MIVVRARGYFLEYPDTMIPKVLQSGALKIVEPVEADVPPMGEEDKEMTVKPEITVAIFNCDYIMTRNDSEYTVTKEEG
jgi:hypothetical protein